MLLDWVTEWVTAHCEAFRSGLGLDAAQCSTGPVNGAGSRHALCCACVPCSPTIKTRWLEPGVCLQRVGELPCVCTVWFLRGCLLVFLGNTVRSSKKSCSQCFGDIMGGTRRNPDDFINCAVTEVRLQWGVSWFFFHIFFFSCKLFFWFQAHGRGSKEIFIIPWKQLNWPADTRVWRGHVSYGKANNEGRYLTITTLKKTFISSYFLINLIGISH